MVEAFAIFTAGLVGFEVLASRYGRDSRDGDDWAQHRTDHA
jgi:hypothetical protein